MKLEYIDENLKMIMANPSDVLYLKPYKVDNKIALFAIVKGQNGIYRKLQITKKQSKLSFPFEPIYWFYQGPGYFYLKDFMVLDNWLALNTANLDGFGSYEIDNKKYNIGIYALFSDGSATFITMENEKKLFKNGGLYPYYDLLKQYKEPNLQREIYCCIDDYMCDNTTIVIPELLDPTNLEFKEIHYQDLAYKDEDGNAIESEFISSKQAQEAVKQLSKIRNRYNK